MMMRSIKPSFASIAILFLLNCITFLQLVEATSVPIATCQLFFNQKGDDICSKRGFQHKANPNKMCDNGVCYVNKCCYNMYVAQQSETCGEFFQRKNQTNICQNNGFAHQRRKQHQCQGKNCYIKQCCYGQVPKPSTSETCGEFFQRKSQNVCQNNGFIHKRGKGYQCKGNKCYIKKCCYGQIPKPKPKQKCGQFFDTHHNQVCSNNHWAQKKGRNVVCATSTCQVNECCTPKETCSEFFVRKGAQVCHNNGMMKKGGNAKCTGTQCKVSECCQPVPPPIVMPSTCSDYYASYIEGTGICTKSGLKHFKPANTICYNATGQLIPCTVQQCCYVENCGDYFDRKKQGTGHCQE
eukprot:Pgem_evm1s130